ncbi:MAG: ATP-binding cassette domain-containing protein [Candidatus Heimdallarchaeota archaeon]|nr:ATP-binding cassette domain-containing protein [Candidatus Heimdallarchaeota archaeon]
MIEISNVTFQYLNSETPILKDFSLQVDKGEIVGIIGPTGSGKSTICYLLNGLIPNYFKGKFEGSVDVCSQDVTKESVEFMSKFVGYMLQEPSFQIASPFVESEITFGMENFGVSFEEMDNQLVIILEKMGISHLRYRTTSELSEGEKQKVILASILAMNPTLLVLDECSSMIDSTSKKELSSILLTLNRFDGKTILLIDHDLDFIAQVANRILLINSGEIVMDSTPKEILTDSKLLMENGLTPPTLTSLFQTLKEKGLPINDIPISYREAEELLKELIK